MKQLKINDQEIKTIAFIIIGGIILFMVYKVLKTFGFLGVKPDPSAQAVTNIDYNSTNLSFTKDELNLKLGIIYDAMDQFGTDEDSLLTQFESLRTKDDLLYLIKTFGVRKY